ncbi:MAG: hypothetical protein IJ229_09975, partial [Clostridia bacterium]|nr:hypothetical protein [Clostridia bacterium]
ETCEITYPEATTEQVYWEIRDDALILESGIFWGNQVSFTVPDTYKLAYLTVNSAPMQAGAGVWAPPFSQRYALTSEALPQVQTCPVTVTPENPTSADVLGLSFDRSYDAASFTFYKDGEEVTSVSFRQNSLEEPLWTFYAGEYDLHCELTMGSDVSVYNLHVSIAQAPIVEPAALISAPDTVRNGESFEVTFEPQEHALGYQLSMLDGWQSVGYATALKKGRVTFDAWPDDLAPGEYTLRLSCTAEDGYDSNDAVTAWKINVLDTERPQATGALSLYYDGEETDVVKKGTYPDYLIRAEGAEAVRYAVEYGESSRSSSIAMALDEDGLNTGSLYIRDWTQSPGVTVKHYVLKDGVWSKPSVRFYRYDDVTVSGALVAEISPASPNDASTVFVSFPEPYEVFNGALYREGKKVQGFTSSHTLTSIYLGVLEAGNYTFVGTGMRDGVWTEEGQLSFEVVSPERYDTPVLVSYPAQIQVGEAFTVKADLDERSRYSTLFLYDGQRKYIGFQNSTDGTFTYSRWPDDSAPGNYFATITSYGNDRERSLSVDFALNVTAGERPAAPKPVVAVEESRTIFRFGEVYEIINLELYTGDNNRYSGTSVFDTDEIAWPVPLADGDWIAVLSVAKEGIVSYEARIPFTVGETAPQKPEMWLDMDSEDGYTLPVSEGVQVGIRIPEDGIDAVEVILWLPGDEKEQFEITADQDPYAYFVDGEYFVGMVGFQPGRFICRARLQVDGVWSAWNECNVLFTSEGTLPDPEIVFDFHTLYEGEALYGRIANYDSDIEYTLQILDGEGRFLGVCEADAFGSDGSFAVTSVSAESDALRVGEGFAAGSGYQVLISVYRYGWSANGWTNAAVDAFDVIPVPTYDRVVKIPEDVKIIENEALAGIDAQAVYVGAACESIAKDALANCASLAWLEIAGADTQLDALALEGTDIMILVTPSGSAAEAVLKGKVHIIHRP